MFIPLALMTTVLMHAVSETDSARRTTGAAGWELYGLTRFHRDAYEHVNSAPVSTGSLPLATVTSLGSDMNIKMEIVENNGGRYLLAWIDSVELGNGNEPAEANRPMGSYGRMSRGEYRSQRFWGAYTTLGDGKALIGATVIPEPVSHIPDQTLVLGIGLS